MLKEASVDFSQQDLEEMVRLMDINHDGSISKQEFTHAVLFQAEGVRPMSMQEMHYDVSWVKNKVEKMSHLIEQIAEVHFQTGSKALRGHAFEAERVISDGLASKMGSEELIVAGSSGGDSPTGSRGRRNRTWAGRPALQPGSPEANAASSLGFRSQSKSLTVRFEEFDERMFDLVSKQKELLDIVQNDILEGVKKQNAEGWASARILLQEDFAALRTSVAAARECSCHLHSSGGKRIDASGGVGCLQGLLHDVRLPREASGLRSERLPPAEPRASPIVEAKKPASAPTSPLAQPWWRATGTGRAQAVEPKFLERADLRAELCLAACGPSANSAASNQLLSAAEDFTSTLRSFTSVEDSHLAALQDRLSLTSSTRNAFHPVPLVTQAPYIELNSELPQPQQQQPQQQLQQLQQQQQQQAQQPLRPQRSLSWSFEQLERSRSVSGGGRP